MSRQKNKTFMSSQEQVPAAGSGYHNFNENAIFIYSRTISSI